MNHNNVVIFDGICNLCSWGVKFIIRRDFRNKFLFAPIQSKIGSRLLLNHGIQTENIESFLLIKDGKQYTKSDAVLEIVSEFRPGWKFFLIFRCIPKSMRDFAYGVIAKNRYRWFGKKDQCMIPSPEMQVRFLE
jgi:predicted DCC family thiol-disulfide oxidoreductase YuxK